jgi:hypothetical protein
MKRADRAPRTALAALVLCMGAAVAPASAAAAPSSVTVYERAPQGGKAGAGFIRLDTSDGARQVAHEVYVYKDSSPTYMIVDRAGIAIAPNTRQAHQQEQRCFQVGEEAVRCELPAGFSRGTLRVELGAGDDVVDLRGAGPALAGSVIAGAGDDRLRGGPASDFLAGGAGQDVVIGYLGRDVLTGNMGNDVVRARDGIADQISCGPGNDRREKAIRDRFDRGVSFTASGRKGRRPISC